MKSFIRHITTCAKYFAKEYFYCVLVFLHCYFLVCFSVREKTNRHKKNTGMQKCVNKSSLTAYVWEVLNPLERALPVTQKRRMVVNNCIKKRVLKRREKAASL